MRKIETGGAAFPSNNDADKYYNWLEKGMTLRDYFAAKAMQVILKDQYEDGIYVGDNNDSEHICADSAYIMANAMLKARENI